MDSESDPIAQLFKHLLTSAYQTFQPLQSKPTKGRWRNTGLEFASPTFHAATRDEIAEVNIQFSIPRS